MIMNQGNASSLCTTTGWEGGNMIMAGINRTGCLMEWDRPYHQNIGLVVKVSIYPLSEMIPGNLV